MYKLYEYITYTSFTTISLLRPTGIFLFSLNSSQMFVVFGAHRYSLKLILPIRAMLALTLQYISIHDKYITSTLQRLDNYAMSQERL